MISVETRGKVLVVKVTGELDEAAIADADRLFDEKLEGREDARVALDLRRYDGADDLASAWRELKLITTHADRVERVAVVGSHDWQKVATWLVSPFTRATERFFAADEVDEALEWLRES